MSKLRNLIFSLFMSKQAREKMDAFHARRRNQPLEADSDLAAPVEQTPTSQSPLPIPDLLTEEEVAEAVAHAIARIDDAEKYSAKTSMKPPKPVNHSPSIGRKELIKMAVDIHKKKQNILDELDDDAREKLYAMAMQAFALNQPKK